VFYAKQDTKADEPVSFTIRVRGVSANTAQTAAQWLGSAYQTAAAGISKGVRQGVYSTRVWAAPQLESAADYHTTTIAPKVSSALLTAAKQVRPVDLTEKKSRSMLTWSALAAAVLATAGAVAALVRYRYRAAVAADEEEEEFDAGMAGAGAATGAESTTQASTADSTATSTDAGVNGRVSTSGW
jgi:hypothetical protein